MSQGIVASTEHENSTYFERTDLDTHANMVVLGRNCHVVNYSGKTAEVHPFSPEYESLQVPIVHAIIQYDDPYSEETFMLVYKEALYVPAMKCNLIPSFLVREAGLVVDDLPKVQSLHPTNTITQCPFQMKTCACLLGCTRYFHTFHLRSRQLVC